MYITVYVIMFLLVCTVHTVRKNTKLNTENKKYDVIRVLITSSILFLTNNCYNDKRVVVAFLLTALKILFAKYRATKKRI